MASYAVAVVLRALRSVSQRETEPTMMKATPQSRTLVTIKLTRPVMRVAATCDIG